MPRPASRDDLTRKLNTAEQRMIRSNVSKKIEIAPELRWTLDPYAPVPKEFRTYGEGVNAELDRAKEIQEQVYAVPEGIVLAPNPHGMGGHDFPCEGAEMGVCPGSPEHAADCPSYYTRTAETETE